MNTPGATKAAAVIMDGRLAIDTEYGRKSAEGIADLIDQKTGAGELLEACRAVLATWNRHNVPIDAYLCRDRGAIEAAIAKAEGK